MPDALANACLVVPQRAARRGWSNPADMLTAVLRADRVLAPRFGRARLVAPPRVLGPMALDGTAAGVPGMLLAGDAGGFIDPITGDGLRLALESATLAASVAIDMLAGRSSPEKSVTRLTLLRGSAFANKWRFNRAIRAFVSSGTMICGAAAVARVFPQAFEAIIRYAGDCE
jgi:hypothetical protein